MRINDRVKMIINQYDSEGILINFFLSPLLRVLSIDNGIVSCTHAIIDNGTITHIGNTKQFILIRSSEV